MKIAVIGGGFTGLSAAYQLSKLGNKVSVFEKDEKPGGLAVGFKIPKWSWTLEKHYHHWFTNDNAALNLANELNYEVLTYRPKTSVYVDNRIYQLDSPLNVLKFPKLSVLERLRMAGVIGAIRYNPFWKLLEGVEATKFLKISMGQNAYSKIWEPQFQNKFAKYAQDISLAWFWARIVKRTPSLAYPKGGFLEFSNALVGKIEEKGGKVLFNTEVMSVISNKKPTVRFKTSALRHSGKPKAHPESPSKSDSGQARMTGFEFDAVIVTLPSFFFLKIAPQLPNGYKNSLGKLKGLGAINLVLRLRKQFLKDGTYWLSICDKNSPIVAIVEHTNFMDKKYYNNEHLVYLGKYLSHNHPYYLMNKEQLLKVYDPYLKKINKDYESSIIDYELFKVPFAQPIIPVNYSKIMPPFETPLKNVYLANIQQVYPWDRGTNYAIEIGEKVAKLVERSL